MGSIVVAVESATVNVGGIIRAVRKGDAWSAEADVVKAHPDLFTADPSQARGWTPEQATRAPGERSSARRGR